MNSNNIDPKATVKNAYDGISQAAIKHIEQCHNTLDDYSDLLQQNKHIYNDDLEPIAEKISTLGKCIQNLLK